MTLGRRCVSATALPMAGLSGLCPQRRCTKPAYSDAFRAMRKPLLTAREISRQGWCPRCPADAKADVSKADADWKHAWWFSSHGVVRIILTVFAILSVSITAVVYGSDLLLFRANDLGRQCTSFRPQSTRHETRSYRFAMVTCSDGSKSVPQRSFEGLMELVTPNKKSYVERHGYDFIDASHMLDKERPPSWSKILAVKKYLPAYDWVFWNDAVRCGFGHEDSFMVAAFC